MIFIVRPDKFQGGATNPLINALYHIAVNVGLGDMVAGKGAV
jgi:hypothetical protein